MTTDRKNALHAWTDREDILITQTIKNKAAWRKPLITAAHSARALLHANGYARTVSECEARIRQLIKAAVYMG